MEILITFGEDFSSLSLKNMTNSLRHNVPNTWIDIHHQIPIRSNNEILQTCIWYNSQIFKSPTYFPDWFKQEIHLIGDISNTNGGLLKLEYINLKFNTNLNILNYYTVYQSVYIFFAKHKQPNKPWIFEAPSCPLHLKYLLDTKNPAKFSTVF